MGMQSIGRPTAPIAANASLSETVSGSKGLQQREDLIFEVGAWDKTGVDLPEPKGRKSRLGGVKAGRRFEARSPNTCTGSATQNSFAQKEIP